MTTKAPHTPGPWKVVFITAGKELHYFIAPNEHASVAEADNMADARLIAAAPDLLVALHAMLDEHADCKGCNASDLAFAAIAKVQGR